MEEVEEILHSTATSFRDRLTKKSLELLQRSGFFGIMLFASVRCSFRACLAVWFVVGVLRSVPCLFLCMLRLTVLQVPNPLFDLAGLMSGHLLIPFATFFGATAIGKGFIKVTIQVRIIPSCVHVNVSHVHRGVILLCFFVH